MPRIVKVAVIGSGLAGLTAAHMLANASIEDEVVFEVHIFEKSSSVGMDSSSITVATHDKKHSWRVDVPMRSFQGGYYNQLISLYKMLGVKFRQSDFSYSYSTLLPSSSQCWKMTTSFIYNGASGRSGFSKPATLKPQTNSKNYLMSPRMVTGILDYAFFAWSIAQFVVCFMLSLFYSLPVFRQGMEEMVFRDWVVHVTPRGCLANVLGLDQAWKNYVETVLTPTFSAVCTGSTEDIMGHPVEDFLDYILLTFGTHHYVVVDGVRHVVARLLAGVKQTHLSSPVMAITPDSGDSRLVSISCLSNGEIREHSGFGHVVFATQASSAVPLLRQFALSLKESQTSSRVQAIQELALCLEAFKYRSSLVINHTDATLLPDIGNNIRDLNFVTAGTDFVGVSKATSSNLHYPPVYTMTTHLLRRPENAGDGTVVYQTTNPILPPRKDSILSVSTLERAVVTMASKKALTGLSVMDQKKWWQVPYQARTRLGPLQGGGRRTNEGVPGLWVCGSYAHIGIPLLEGCVISAKNVVEQGILRCEETI